MKRAIAAAMMVFALLPLMADTIDVGAFTCSFNSATNTATVTAYNGSASHVDIPSSIEVPEQYKGEDGEWHTRYKTYRVTSINSSVFANRTFITTVDIPSVIEFIGSQAFEGCTGLSSVRTSGSLKSIGARAFKDCSSLISAEIDGTNLDLTGSQNIFEGCTNLRYVRFGDGVVGLCGGYITYPHQSNTSGVFKGCTSIETVVVGKGLMKVPSCFLSNVGSDSHDISVSLDGPISYVGYSAFDNARITSLEINLSNCTVYGYGFFGCKAVTTESIDFAQIVSIGPDAFHDCVNLEGDIYLDVANSIGSYAFDGCTGISSVRTSGLLTYIGNQAFKGCTSLESASIDGTDLDLSNSPNIFEGCANLKSVRFGDGVVGLSGGYTTYPHQSNTSGVFYGCTRIETVIVGKGLKTVPRCFLSNVGNDGHGISVSFDGPISYVGYSAFDNAKITSLAINLSSCTVEGYGFFGCRGVTAESIDFAQIVSIGPDAFHDCVNITNEVVFADKLISIGSSAFANCVNAHDFTFLGAPPSASSSSFSGVKSGAIGTYTVEYEAEWKAVIDSRGYWNGLKMRPSYYTVHYDLNGGSGEISDDVVEYGAEGAKIKAHGVTWEGCYFLGWAFEPNGEVVYVEGDTVAEPTGDESTMTLYAKWMPVPELEIESVDWTKGEIKLRWVSGDDESATWWPCTVYRGTTEDIFSAEALPDAQEITAVSYVDKSFLVATPVTSPLYYWVMPVGVDVSLTDVKPVKTRSRRYLCVGNTSYENNYETSLLDGDAEAFANILKRGGFEGAVQKNVSRTELRSAIKGKIGECNKGDIFVFYIMAHGGSDVDQSGGRRSFLAMKPSHEYYFNTELAADLSTADPDIAVISFLPVCHSGAIIDFESNFSADYSQDIAYMRPDVSQFLSDGLGQCSANMAAIAACSADASAPAFEGIGKGIANPLTYFCENAINKGVADDDPLDGMVTWQEMFDYVQEMQRDFTPSSVAEKVDSGDLLSRIVLVADVNKESGAPPSAPTGVQAWIEGEKVCVRWNASASDEFHIVSGDFSFKDGSAYSVIPQRINSNIFFDLKYFVPGQEATIRVAAVNAYGKSDETETAVMIPERESVKLLRFTATKDRCDGIQLEWVVAESANVCIIRRNSDYALFPQGSLEPGKTYRWFDNEVIAGREVNYSIFLLFDGEDDAAAASPRGIVCGRRDDNVILEVINHSPETIGADGGYVFLRIRRNGPLQVTFAGDKFLSIEIELDDVLVLFCGRNTGRHFREQTIKLMAGGKECSYTLRQAGVDSLPDAENDEEVSAVLANSEDNRLCENVTKKTMYDDYRYWMSRNDISVEEASCSPHTYPSFLLGTEKLLANEPTIKLSEVTLGENDASGTDITLDVTVMDGENSVKVAEEKVANMFEATSDLGDWAGEAKLTPTVEVLEGEGNTMRFKVKPGDGKSQSAFLRIRK